MTLLWTRLSDLGLTQFVWPIPHITLFRVPLVATALAIFFWVDLQRAVQRKEQRESMEQRKREEAQAKLDDASDRTWVS